MTTVVVRQPHAQVVARFSPAGALQQSNSPVTLKSAVGTSGVNRLDQLLDVSPDSLSTPAGSTLVYDPITDTYIVKLLDLDGGTF
jgi:hypothetical protein